MIIYKILLLGGIADVRAVGCCSHAATIIWYLGKGKHSQYKPKSDTFSTTVNDAADYFLKQTID